MGFAPLVPELLVHDFATSLAFYQTVDFSILYDRPEENFAFLIREDACLMIEEGDGVWYTEAPGAGQRGRGTNLQIGVADVATISNAVNALGVQPVRGVNERVDRTIRGPERYREIMVADPDGYRLRFMQLTG